MALPPDHSEEAFYEAFDELKTLGYFCLGTAKRNQGWICNDGRIAGATTLRAPNLKELLELARANPLPVTYPKRLERYLRAIGELE